MKLVRKWVELGSPDRWLVLHALILVVAATFGLKLIPLRRVPAFLAWMDRFFPDRLSGNPDRERLIWAEIAVAKKTRSTCLIQALAAQQLLKRKGYPAHLCIGVAKNENRELAAHAWVECNGLVVIGGPPAAIVKYTQIAIPEGIFS